MVWVVLAILVLILVPAAWAGMSMAPFVPVWNSDLDRLLSLIKLKEDESFVELGSGTGRVLMAVAERYPENDVLGVEIQPVLWAWTWIRLGKWRKLGKVNVVWRDFLRTDLSRFDWAFLYGTPDRNEIVGKKLRKKLKAGAKVVSYAFEMPGWKVVRVSEEKGRLPIYIYEI